MLVLIITLALAVILLLMDKNSKSDDKSVVKGGEVLFPIKKPTSSAPRPLPSPNNQGISRPKAKK